MSSELAQVAEGNAALASSMKPLLLSSTTRERTRKSAQSALSLREVEGQQLGTRQEKRDNDSE